MEHSKRKNTGQRIAGNDGRTSRVKSTARVLAQQRHANYSHTGRRKRPSPTLSFMLLPNTMLPRFHLLVCRGEAEITHSRMVSLPTSCPILELCSVISGGSVGQKTYYRLECVLCKQAFFSSVSLVSLLLPLLLLLLASSSSSSSFSLVFFSSSSPLSFFFLSYFSSFFLFLSVFVFLLFFLLSFSHSSTVSILTVVAVRAESMPH